MDREACLAQNNLPGVFSCTVDVHYVKNNLEEVTRLVLHCRVTNQLWNMFLSIFGMSWTMPNFIIEILKCCTGKKFAGKLKRPGALFLKLSGGLFSLVKIEESLKAKEETYSTLNLDRFCRPFFGAK